MSADAMDLYSNVSKIGEGTYGIVYKATSKEAKREVALKKIKWVDILISWMIPREHSLMSSKEVNLKWNYLLFNHELKASSFCFSFIWFNQCDYFVYDISRSVNWMIRLRLSILWATIDEIQEDDERSNEYRFLISSGWNFDLFELIWVHWTFCENSIWIMIDEWTCLLSFQSWQRSRGNSFNDVTWNRHLKKSSTRERCKTLWRGSFKKSSLFNIRIYENGFETSSG